MAEKNTSDIKKKVSDEELEELIHSYCRDFTALERAGRFDPIFGRDEEVDEMILILLQKGRKNVCLLAPAGVGKTAMCVALAQRIVKGDVPEMLKTARLIEIDLASMAAGTNGPAEFQGRFIPLCRGIAERYHDPDEPPIILFIDEIHTIMPTVEGSAYRGLSEVMKPYLTVGDLCVIGATTVDEHRMFVAEDPAMDRRFQKIHLKIPSDEETVMILEALRPGYEKHHGIKIPDSCLEEIVELTSEHMRTRNQPDKSIITLDSSCAHHVKEFGSSGELTLESVYTMMARETGLHKAAFAEDMTHMPTEREKAEAEGNKTEQSADDAQEHDTQEHEASPASLPDANAALPPDIMPLPGGQTPLHHTPEENENTNSSSSQTHDDKQGDADESSGDDKPPPPPPNQYN